jgi:hypothetical protein
VQAAILAGAKEYLMLFKVFLTKAARDAEWVKTNRKDPYVQVSVDTATLTPAQRQILVDAEVERSFTSVPVCHYAVSAIGNSIESTPVEFDHVPTVDEILAVIAAEAPRKREAVAQVNDTQKRLVAEAQEKNRLAAEAKARAEAERKQWIADHGSDRLKQCTARGYNCDRLYWIERAALDYPGYVLDYNDTAYWNERTCPSEQALNAENEAMRLYPNATARIVWLTNLPSNGPTPDDYTYSCEGHEALTLDVPDLKYWLVKSL